MRRARIEGQASTDYVEVDANPNPLRDIFCAPTFQVKDGSVSLTNAPGMTSILMCRRAKTCWSGSRIERVVHLASIGSTSDCAVQRLRSR